MTAVDNTPVLSPPPRVLTLNAQYSSTGVNIREARLTAIKNTAILCGFLCAYVNDARCTWLCIMYWIHRKKNKISCISKEHHRQCVYLVTIVRAFCSCDLDLDPMTLAEAWEAVLQQGHVPPQLWLEEGQCAPNFGPLFYGVGHTFYSLVLVHKAVTYCG